MSTGTFYHAVVTYVGSGNAWILYLNGTTYNASGATPNTSVAAMAIGKNIVNNVQYFNGSIDEVGIWSRELTSGEVTSLYNAGAGLQYPFNSSTATFSNFLMMGV